MNFGDSNNIFETNTWEAKQHFYDTPLLWVQKQCACPKVANASISQSLPDGQKMFHQIC